MSMETIVYALCACGKEEVCLTMRKVKNYWPFCSCKKSMKVTDHDQRLLKSRGEETQERILSFAPRSEPSIEKNVPVPHKVPRCIPLYPWLHMQPNDSFTVSGRVAAAAARGSFDRYQKLGRIPKSFKCTQSTEDDGITVRLWLVAQQYKTYSAE